MKIQKHGSGQATVKNHQRLKRNRGTERGRERERERESESEREREERQRERKRERERETEREGERERQRAESITGTAKPCLQSASENSAVKWYGMHELA